MLAGYLIVVVCLALCLLHTVVQRDKSQREPRLRNPKYQKMKELLEAGQIFRGSVRLREGDREAVYTVKLSMQKGFYEYATYKDGQAHELLREKDFRSLLREIELGGIVQPQELDLPF
jgi:hypothetical protein